MLVTPKAAVVGILKPAEVAVEFVSIPHNHSFCRPRAFVSRPQHILLPNIYLDHTYSPRGLTPSYPSHAVGLASTYRKPTLRGRLATALSTWLNMMIRPTITTRVATQRMLKSSYTLPEFLEMSRSNQTSNQACCKAI